MKYMRKKSKFSKITILLIIVCIASFLIFNRTNQNKTSNIAIQERRAAVTDSSYNTVQSGYNCAWEVQHNGYVCYAYSICAAMEANVFVKYGENVNFKETHIINVLNKGINGSNATEVWNEYLMFDKGPVSDDAYEIRSYNAINLHSIDSNVDAMKAALITYGGLDAGVDWTGNPGYRQQLSDGSWALCTPSGGPGIGHGVTVLGWDDNYPSSNFPAASGVTQNGAFYAYNPATGGVLWISYQDRNVMSQTYAVEMAKIDEGIEPSIGFSTDGLTINDIPFGGDISFTYTGESFDDQLLVTAFFNTQGVQLHEDTDFYVECSPNAAVGTFQMFIKGMGAYEGQQLQQAVNITPKDIVTIDKIEITKVNDDGTVNVEAVYGNLNLINGTDYDIEYKDSATAGKKVATIRGKGNYNGWAEREFSVNTTPDPGTNPDPGTVPNPPATDKLAVTINTYGTKEVGGTKYINKITEKQTITNLESNVKSNGTIEIYDGTNKVSDKNTKIKTGMKLVAKKDSETVEYILVVNGDVNGDGIINGIDLMKVSRYVSGADKNLTGANLVAANVSDATKDTIDDKDSLRISRYMISLEANLN